MLTRDLFAVANLVLGSVSD